MIQLRRKLMGWVQIFKDTNEYNEKNIVGFASFAVMVLFALADAITGLMGFNLAVNEFIFNSFVFITLGSFGIAEIGKIFGKKSPSSDIPEDPEAVG